MALSEARYNVYAPFDIDEVTLQDLHAFERSTLQSGSAASDDSVFAYAVGRAVDAPLYTAQERDEARRFLAEAFRAAGMKGEPTDINKHLPPPNARPYANDGDEESDVFNYGVR